MIKMPRSVIVCICALLCECVCAIVVTRTCAKRRNVWRIFRNISPELSLTVCGGKFITS